MLTLRSRWLMLAILAAALPRPAATQIREPRGASVRSDTEVEAITGRYVGIRAVLSPYAGREAFEEMGPGAGVGAVAGVIFDDLWAVGIQLGVVSHSDDLDYDGDRASSRARIVDLSASVRYTWMDGDVTVRTGPLVGYTRASRELFTEAAGGVTVGGLAEAHQTLGGALRLSAEVSFTWSTFAPSPVPGDTADEEANGRRLRAAVGLTWVR